MTEQNVMTDNETCGQCGAHFDSEPHEHGCANADCNKVDYFDAANVVMDSMEDQKRQARNKRARENRRAREDALKSCGLVKVRGALGGVYWE